MQNQKLAHLLHRVEAGEPGGTQDQLFNIDDELAKNIRAVHGGTDGSCRNNEGCYNNGVCSNNMGCNGNGMCTTRPAEIDD